MSILWTEAPVRWRSRPYAHALAQARPQLLQLDHFIHSQLAALVPQRQPPHITSHELVQLVDWKLRRGKFRPRLKQFAASNPDELVVQVSSRAFAEVDEDLGAALDCLCDLKGIGPATASLILSIADPSVPFMCDEAYNAVPDLPPVKYTKKAVIQFVSSIRKETERLNEALKDEDDTDQSPFTPAELGKLLWAAADVKPRKTAGRKRKRQDEEKK